MLEILNLIIINFAVDLMLSLLIRKIFKLQTSYFEILMLQIINIAPVIIFGFCEIKPVLFLMLKFLAGLLVCLLVTDSFKPKNLARIYFCYLVLLFSVYGLTWFLLLFFHSTFHQLTGENFSKVFDFIIFLLVVGYILLVYIFVKTIKDYKTLHDYLAIVSFSVFNKHIEIIGLLDSGNSLKDTLTKKPVIVVSIDLMKKYFKDITRHNFEKSGFCERKINCVSAGGLSFEMPIFDVGAVCVKSGDSIKSYDCVLGFVNQKFYDTKNYQCLLHRDFMWGVYV